MKLAFVTPWYGADIPGGAEAEARSTIHKLKDAGVPVEVLTTCIKEFQSDWGRNHHRPGVETINGVQVRRFKVERRNAREFDRVNRRLMSNQPITPAEESVYVNEIFKCPELVRHIRANQQDTVYAFIPYMFASTYWGSLAAPDRSILIPCLHDESYAYMDVYKPMFEQARGVIFHAKAEKALAERLYRMRDDAPVLLGEGINTDFASDPRRFKDKYGFNRYLLYAGRKDEGKNVPLLIDYFCRYKALYPGDLKLVLIGNGPVRIPEEHLGDVIDLGFVPAQDKYDAYGGAIALCQPSLNESFSIVLMESWVAGTPVLVHEDCDVTRDQVLSSSGGLYFSSFSDFVGALEFYLNEPEKRLRMGQNGRRYVFANYTWDHIVQKYLKAMQQWGFEF